MFQGVSDDMGGGGGLKGSVFSQQRNMDSGKTTWWSASQKHNITSFVQTEFSWLHIICNQAVDRFKLRKDVFQCEMLIYFNNKKSLRASRFIWDAGSRRLIKVGIQTRYVHQCCRQVVQTKGSPDM